jgi:hypothetical protein
MDLISLPKSGVARPLVGRDISRSFSLWKFGSFQNVSAAMRVDDLTPNSRRPRFGNDSPTRSRCFRIVKQMATSVGYGGSVLSKMHSP